MDHAMMDHSRHGSSMQNTANTMGHSMPDMPMEDMCSMNMIFTWDWKNTCVIFKWWHVKTYHGFILTVIGIILLGMGYEFVRSWFSNWEKAFLARLPTATNQSTVSVRDFKIKRGILYGFQVWYSFMLMLVFMTYNGWLMVAVALGAGIGNYIWGSCTDSGSVRAMSCH
ncbi:Copper transport protein CTR2 [Spathaspora sp. JA1]|nr:Copper transport protein CTR2 [Spathaspora sp. JA1]